MRARVVVVGVAGIALGVAALATALIVGGGGTGGGDVLVNPPGVIDSHSTPTIARHPGGTGRVALVNRVDRPTFSALLHTSGDGGRSWETSPLPLPDGLDRPFAPDAVFGPDGRLYVTYVNLTGQGNTPEHLWVATSDDGGRTVSLPRMVVDRPTFQSRVTVAPDGTLHTTWVEASDIGLLAFPGTTQIVTARSTDGGATWTDTVPVSDPASRPRVGAATPRIAPDGSVLVLYEDFRDDVRDFGNLPGPPWEGTFALVLARSEDGGATFAETQLESEIVPTQRFLPFLPEFPGFDVAPDGTLYATWTDGRHGDRDVLLRVSRDGGASWSDPLRVNTNPQGDGTDQYLPAVEVAPDGTVNVVFYDRRRDPTNVMTEVFLATAPPGSLEFTDRPISAVSFDSRIGPSASTALPPDHGSRLALDAGPDDVLAAWTDARFGSVATARLDIIATSIPRGGDLPAPLLVGIAAVAVAAVAGVRARVRSRRRGREVVPA